jgi:hypothetical protein
METEQHTNIGSTDGAGAVKTATEARQGVKLGVMRWVLGVSLALAIIGVAIAYYVA